MPKTSSTLTTKYTRRELLEELELTRKWLKTLGKLNRELLELYLERKTDERI
jgi:hypothetical protein